MAEDLSGVTFRVVDSVDAAMAFLTWLGERHEGGVIAVDTETGEYPGRPRDDAFSPWHGRLRLVQVGDTMTGWAIPWERWNGVFHEAMERFEGQVICHNISFEYKWFEVQSGFRMPWHRAHDTMIMSQIVDPTMSAALKSLTSRFVDRKAAGLQQLLDQEMADNGWTWGTIPVSNKKYLSYGALDTVLTARLYLKLLPLIEPYKHLYDMEMAVRRICSRMEINGARVDVDYSRAQQGRTHDVGMRIKEWAKNEYGINAGSPTQLIDVFTNRLGGVITETTPSGAPKIDKDQLRKFAADPTHPERAQLAEYVLKMRKAFKLSDTYFANFVGMQEDGILHPSIGTMAARTSRMSIRAPALQTLNKGEKIVRDAFIARDPDSEVLISSDLDQVEFRMLACFANDLGDPALAEMFLRCDATGSDSFTEILRELYSDPSATKGDKRRKLVKGYVYSSSYGAGIDKMAAITGVPYAQMKEVSDAFDLKYPGKKRFSQKLEDEAMRNQRATGEAFIMNWVGRRMPVDEGKAYTATNYAIQSGAADVFKYNLCKLDAAGLTEQLVVPVHDEIVLSVPRAEEADYRRSVQECMTTTTGWAVPLTAGCDGPYTRWGDAIDE